MVQNKKTPGKGEKPQSEELYGRERGAFHRRQAGEKTQSGEEAEKTKFTP